MRRRSIRRIKRTLVATLVIIGALVAPMSRVGAQDDGAPAVPPGLGIGLTEVPESRRDDPRARQYIVDHVAPGTVITRAFEVSNGTDAPVTVDLYAAAATLDDGAFVPGLRGAESELTEWATVEPAELTIPPGGRAPATVTIAVPADADGGERYGIVAAEGRPVAGAAVDVVPRVGIRIYLSVGGGSEPGSDFVVDSLQAAREDDGTPVVLARVENTGGRALDMRGELVLEDGPGGLSAGPFPAELGTTIAPGESSPVRIALDPEIPDGPWTARLALQSGSVSREVEAEITFPSEPGLGEEVEPDPVDEQRRILIPVAAGAVVVALAGTGWSLRVMRRRQRAAP